MGTKDLAYIYEVFKPCSSGELRLDLNLKKKSKRAPGSGSTDGNIPGLNVCVRMCG